MNIHCKKSTVALKHSPQHLQLSFEISCSNSGVALSCQSLDICSSDYLRTSHYVVCLTSITCSLFSHHLSMEEDVAPGLLFFSRDFFFLVLSAHVAVYWIKQGHKASFTLRVEGCEAYDGLLLLRLLFSLTESFPKAMLPAHLSKWKSAPLS